MKRRPHWDQELEQAVSAVLFDCYENGISEEQVYQVIAAVEDWHEKFVMHGAFRVLAERAASAEADRDRLANQAAIARVRELHGRHDPNCPYGEDCAGAGLCLACREEYPCATIRALDGLEGRIDD